MSSRPSLRPGAGRGLPAEINLRLLQAGDLKSSAIRKERTGQRGQGMSRIGACQRIGEEEGAAAGEQDVVDVRPALYEPAQCRHGFVGDPLTERQVGLEGEGLAEEPGGSL